MPKATTETSQSDPRIARAILSAPYPLASIRARPYIIFRPINRPSPSHGQVPFHPAGPHGISFGPNAPYFYGSHLGLGLHPPAPQPGQNDQNPAWAGSLGRGGWPMPITIPALQHHPIIETEGQRVAAQQLSEALRTPLDASEASGKGGGKAQSGALYVAHEVGKMGSLRAGSSAPRGPPHSLNLLTSTFQTTLPRSLLEFRQMHDALITPPVMTSSTTFYSGFTAGGGETARPSPTTPIAPLRFSSEQTPPLKGRKYGQRERESSGEDSDGGWSSDATITKQKYRSPISTRLETPSTPRPITSRFVRSRPIRNMNKGKDSSPAPLFLGQTNLSPFTYDLSRRRHHSGSGSTMSMIGFESDATNTTVIRVPRSVMKQREGLYGSNDRGLFWKPGGDGDGLRGNGKGKHRMGRSEEDRMENARTRPLTPIPSTPDYPRSFMPPSGFIHPTPNAMGGITPRIIDAYCPTPRLPPSERPYSPQPISIDPQSAQYTNPTSGWPNLLQPSYTADNYPMAMEDLQTETPHTTAHRDQAPFTKACHNFLFVRHRQAARRRRLLLDYHRRVKVEEEEEEGRMQIDTPAVTTFAASQQAASATMASTSCAIPPYPQQPSALTIPSLVPTQHYYSALPQGRNTDRHEVAIRNVAGIARVAMDDGKPARKRRRDLSPESAYQPGTFTPHTFAPGFQDLHPTRRSPTPSISYRLGHGLPVSPSLPHPSLSLSPRLGNDGSTARATAPSTLLPSIHLRAPPNLSATNIRDHHHDYHPRITLPQMPGEASGDAGIARGYLVAPGHFDFERGRAEETDRRLMEEMKTARRDVWLEEIGASRARSRDVKRGLARR